jgi:hypothetical protein
MHLDVLLIADGFRDDLIEHLWDEKESNDNKLIIVYVANLTW